MPGVIGRDSVGSTLPVPGIAAIKQVDHLQTEPDARRCPQFAPKSSTP